MPEPNHTPKFRRKKQIPQHLNKVYGRLTILREAIGNERLAKYPDRQQVVCLCSCGNHKTRLLSSILAKDNVSCGCKPIRDPRVKKCSKCKRIKLRLAFSPQAGNRLICGLASQCKPCKSKTQSASNARHAEARRQQRESVKEQTRKRQREWDWKRQYGITEADYHAMLAEQGGGCGICGATNPGSKTWQVFCVDHDHITGKVRGLLCLRCNSKLGMLGDDLNTVLANLSPYLKYLKLEVQVGSAAAYPETRSPPEQLAIHAYLRIGVSD